MRPAPFPILLLTYFLTYLPTYLPTYLLAASCSLRPADGRRFDGNWGRRTADGKLQELDNKHQTALQLVLERIVAAAEDESDEDEDEDGDVEPGAGPRSSDLRDVELLRLLVSHGADVNTQDVHGKTSLHQAVY